MYIHVHEAKKNYINRVYIILLLLDVTESQLSYFPLEALFEFVKYT